MNYPHKIADELIPVLTERNSQPAPPEGTKPEDVLRKMLADRAEQFKIQSDSQLTVRDKFFKNSDGVDIQLRTYTPAGQGKPLPCLYWMHGGGTISGLPEQEDPTLRDLALAVPCVIVSVNYRLAPENPYPAPIDDCYEGLEYVAENADEFGIDARGIAVGGASAGGLLATSCAILARNRRGPKLVHQSLTYPMLDHRGISDSNKEIPDLGIWDRHMNRYGFGCYLTGVENDALATIVPNLVRDLSNLPPAFLAVGTMDVLRDETIEYAQKLAAAGVVTELHLYPGMVHAFDELVPDSTAAKDFSAARVSALQRAFGSKVAG